MYVPCRNHTVLWPCQVKTDISLPQSSSVAKGKHTIYILIFRYEKKLQVVIYIFKYNYLIKLYLTASLRVSFSDFHILFSVKAIQKVLLIMIRFAFTTQQIADHLIEK